MPEIAPQRSLDASSGDFQFTPRMVLFATDFSRPCQNAWPYALAIAHEYHSKLLLAHVIDSAVFAPVPSELVGAAAREQVRGEKEDQLKHLQRSESSRQFDFELLLREGEITDVLLRIVQVAPEAIMATQPVRGVQQSYQTRLGSPYCCDPTCRSCEAPRNEYDRLKKISPLSLLAAPSRGCYCAAPNEVKLARTDCGGERKHPMSPFDKPNPSRSKVVRLEPSCSAPPLTMTRCKVLPVKHH
jgi:hypothetical protein